MEMHFKRSGEYRVYWLLPGKELSDGLAFIYDDESLLRMDLLQVATPLRYVQLIRYMIIVWKLWKEKRVGQLQIMFLSILISFVMSRDYEVDPSRTGNARSSQLLTCSDCTKTDIQSRMPED